MTLETAVVNAVTEVLLHDTSPCSQSALEGRHSRAATAVGPGNRLLMLWSRESGHSTMLPCCATCFQSDTMLCIHSCRSSERDMEALAEEVGAALLLLAEHRKHVQDKLRDVHGSLVAVRETVLQA